MSGSCARFDIIAEPNISVGDPAIVKGIDAAMPAVSQGGGSGGDDGDDGDDGEGDDGGEGGDGGSGAGAMATGPKIMPKLASREAHAPRNLEMAA